LLTPPSGAVGGAPSRGDQSHPPARAPCRPPCPPCAGALCGGVTAPPVGVARRRRDAAAAVAAAAPLSPPHILPATAAWLYVPPCALAAMEPAGVSGVDASPSAPPPLRPGYCTHVPGALAKLLYETDTERAPPAVPIGALIGQSALIQEGCFPGSCPSILPSEATLGRSIL